MMLRVVLLLACLTLVGPVSVSAQDQGDAGDAGASQVSDTTDLVFEREVFAYPRFQRRNPMEPLLADESGPRFESMQLRMIIYAPEAPEESVALISAGALGGGSAGGLSRRMRVGERWGSSRIAEIRPDEVVVEVQEFGLVERRVLVMPEPQEIAQPTIEGQDAATDTTQVQDTTQASGNVQGGT